MRTARSCVSLPPFCMTLAEDFESVYFVSVSSHFDVAQNQMFAVLGKKKKASSHFAFIKKS